MACQWYNVTMNSCAAYLVRNLYSSDDGSAKRNPTKLPTDTNAHGTMSGTEITMLKQNFGQGGNRGQVAQAQNARHIAILI